jgi:hypothetical protein
MDGFKTIENGGQEGDQAFRPIIYFWLKLSEGREKVYWGGIRLDGSYKLWWLKDRLD